MGLEHWTSEAEKKKGLKSPALHNELKMDHRLKMQNIKL